MKNILNSLILLAFISCGKAPIFQNDVKKNQQINEQELIHQFSNSPLNFAIEWLNGPRLYEKSTFKLRFWNNTNSIFGPYEKLNSNPCVFLWMKMPDGSEHGSAPVTISVEVQNGNTIYVIDDVYFIMNGVWQIRIRELEENQVCDDDKNSKFLNEEIIEVYIN